MSDCRPARLPTAANTDASEPAATRRKLSARRQWLVGTGLLAAQVALPGLPQALAAGPEPAKAGTAGKPLGELELFIPGGAGGGWDQTGRVLGAALEATGVGRVSYTHRPGQGGLLGLQEYLQRPVGAAPSLLVGGFVMVGALALHGRSELLKRLSPVARLTNDYLALCAAPDGSLTKTAALLQRLREGREETVFVGGSLGGVDHILVEMLLQTLRLDKARVRYLPTTSGKEALARLLSNEAHIAVSGVSEFKADIEAGRVKCLAVSSRKGRGKFQSLREQGIDVELANWRGVFTAAQVPPVEQARLLAAVKQAVGSSGWRKALAEQDWASALQYGDEFADFVDIQSLVVSVVSSLLALRSSQR